VGWAEWENWSAVGREEDGVYPDGDGDDDDGEYEEAVGVLLIMPERTLFVCGGGGRGTFCWTDPSMVVLNSRSWPDPLLV